MDPRVKYSDNDTSSQIFSFCSHNCCERHLISYLWHPGEWSAGYQTLRGPGQRRNDVQTVVRPYPPRWWCGLTKKNRKNKKTSGNVKTFILEWRYILQTGKYLLFIMYMYILCLSTDIIKCLQEVFSSFVHNCYHICLR